MIYTILIGLTIILTATTCLGQNNKISDELQKAYLNEGWFYSEMDSGYVAYQAFDTLYSPDKKFEILIRTVGLSDLVRKSQYYLIRISARDTIELMTVIRRDFNPPNLYWTSNGYLIYEEGNEGQNSQIHLRNLRTNKIEFSTNGAIPVAQEWSQNFYDRKNEILIYFKLGNAEADYKADLMVLELKSKTVRKLMTFETKLNYEYPIVSLNTATRKLKVKYQDLFSSRDIITYDKELEY